MKVIIHSNTALDQRTYTGEGHGGSSNSLARRVRLNVGISWIRQYNRRTVSGLNERTMCRVLTTVCPFVFLAQLFRTVGLDVLGEG